MTGLVRMTDHFEPFHSSMSWFWVKFGFRLADPTAMHEVAATHDMPYNARSRGLGVGTKDQFVPFQDSASADPGLPWPP